MKEKSISWYLVHDVHSTFCGKNEYNGKASFYLSEDLAREAVYFKITTVTCYSRKLSQRGNNKYLFLKINGYR